MLRRGAADRRERLERLRSVPRPGCALFGRCSVLSSGRTSRGCHGQRSAVLAEAVCRPSPCSDGRSSRKFAAAPVGTPTTSAYRTAVQCASGRRYLLRRTAPSRPWCENHEHRREPLLAVAPMGSPRRCVGSRGSLALAPRLRPPALRAQQRVLAAAMTARAAASPPLRPLTSGRQCR